MPKPTKSTLADTVCAVVFMAYTVYLIYLGFTAHDSVWLTIGFLVIVWIVCNAINFYLIHAMIRHITPNRP